MCLGIPARISEILSEEQQLATVEIGGARRAINTSLIADEGVAVGDWVVVHVGFALTKMDEEEARRTLEELAALGAAFEAEVAAFSESRVE